MPSDPDSSSSKSNPSHPPVQQMVDEAIDTLKRRNGSSLIAIKKHIATKYDLDIHTRLDTFIKKYLKKSVSSGKLLQAKGKGATGSFKLSVAGKKELLMAEVARAKKKKSLTPVKPKVNGKTSHKLKKKASKPDIEVKTKSGKDAKEVVNGKTTTKDDVGKMKTKTGENGNAKQANLWRPYSKAKGDYKQRQK